MFAGVPPPPRHRTRGLAVHSPRPLITGPREGNPTPALRHVPPPTSAQLQALVQQIAERIGRLLEKRGLIERDMENAWLTTDGSGGALDDLIGHSITYRIAVGPRAGQKLFTLHTLSASAMPQAEQ